MKALIKLIFTSFVIISLVGCFSQNNNDNNNLSCGDITIAEMTWASAQLLANIDKTILDNGYNCNTTIVAGDTNPTFASITSKGRPDIAPEMWTNAFKEPLKKAVAENKVKIINQGPISGLGEGWWLDAKTAKEHPELKTVLDVLERPDLFPYKEDNSKGAFYSCPAGWACQIVNNNLFKAFAMEEKGWVLVNPGSGAGLDGSIAKANEQGDSWFGYYWAPTAMIGKYNLQLLDFGVPYDGDQHWNDCISKVDCANPKKTAWTKSNVNTIISAKFADNVSDEVQQYLSARVLPSSVVNQMLVYMDTNKASGADAAMEFFSQYPDIWKGWLSPSAIENMERKLNF